MKKMHWNTHLLVLLLFILATFKGVARPGEPWTLWYDKPATVWNEALPVGNGRIAAMVFGDPTAEHLQLNEETFWSGGPSNNNNPEAIHALDDVRAAIFAGDYRKADQLANAHMKAKELHGSKYQTLGDLHLVFEGHEHYTKYYRGLNIDRAVHTSQYEVDGVTYTRETYASFPDQVLVVRLTASQPGKLNFRAFLNSPLQTSAQAIDATTYELTCLSGSHEGVEGQVRAHTQTKLLLQGGRSFVEDKQIRVQDATEVVLLTSMATNFVRWNDLSGDAKQRCLDYASKAVKRTQQAMMDEHVAAYQALYRRVSFDLGSTEAILQPTDVRIRDFSKQNDPALVSLYFQFGRYLLISSSQPGGQPANLQGVWNGSTNPAWDSKYTININTEMNYWPAEKCNLTEMHEPLVQMIQELSEAGQVTAKEMYGARGWVAHHNTDIWRISGLVDFANAGLWPMGSAWLSQHLWEKYLYSGDRNYLKQVYPILKSACTFYEDFLIEEPVNKWLVVSPSISPENTPSGHASALTAGTTMDNQLLFDLFTKTTRAAKTLDIDAADVKRYEVILDRLPPMQIGKHGQLQEWMGDWDNPNDKHRHVSHLYGMHPGDQISPYRNPELFDAVRTSMIHRGDVSTGWSMGWKVNLWARLLDGNHARKMITDQLTLVDPVRAGYSSGGTYPNMFDAHPPFQIDGNFGCTAGIAEMLMQCHDGAIHLLPALPDDWTSGSMKGLRAQGGFDVDFEWENGLLTQLRVRSNLGGNLRLRVPNEIKGKKLKQAKGANTNPFYAVPAIKKPLISEQARLNPVLLPKTQVYDVQTKAGKTYTFILKN